MQKIDAKIDPLRVYVVSGGMEYIRMFFDAGFRGAKGVEDADILCFTGGEDVHPSFYGEKALHRTYSNIQRDEKEAATFKKALYEGVPMIGICRGSQFLNVMSGGKLWQHVNNHAVGAGHAITDVKSGEVLEGMTSTHHQQMIPGEGADVIALAALSTEKFSFGSEMTRAEPRLDDTEVVWYPETKCLCFQPHPEFSAGKCRDYFLDCVDQYVLGAVKDR